MGTCRAADSSRGKAGSRLLFGINWEVLKQKGHYNRRDRTQGKDTEKPEGKEETGWMEEERESFSGAVWHRKTGPEGICWPAVPSPLLLAASSSSNVMNLLWRVPFFFFFFGWLLITSLYFGDFNFLPKFIHDYCPLTSIWPLDKQLFSFLNVCSSWQHWVWKRKNIPTPLFSPFIIPVGKSQLQTASVATDPDEK